MLEARVFFYLVSVGTSPRLGHWMVVSLSPFCLPSHASDCLALPILQKAKSQLLSWAVPEPYQDAGAVRTVCSHLCGRCVRGLMH